MLITIKKKYKMRKSIFNKIGVRKALLVPVIFTALTLGGCDKITDLQPNNSFSEETAFSSAARAELAMVGVYIRSATAGRESCATC